VRWTLKNLLRCQKCHRLGYLPCQSVIQRSLDRLRMQRTPQFNLSLHSRISIGWTVMWRCPAEHWKCSVSLEESPFFCCGTLLGKWENNPYGKSAMNSPQETEESPKMSSFICRSRVSYRDDGSLRVECISHFNISLHRRIIERCKVEHWRIRPYTRRESDLQLHSTTESVERRFLSSTERYVVW